MKNHRNIVFKNPIEKEKESDKYIKITIKKIEIGLGFPNNNKHKGKCAANTFLFYITVWTL